MRGLVYVFFNSPRRYLISHLWLGVKYQCFMYVYMYMPFWCVTLHTMITKINNSPTAKGTAYMKGLMAEMVSRFAFLYCLRWNIDFKTFYTELPLWYDNEPSTECHFLPLFIVVFVKETTFNASLCLFTSQQLFVLNSVVTRHFLHAI